MCWSQAIDTKDSLYYSTYCCKCLEFSMKLKRGSMASCSYRSLWIVTSIVLMPQLKYSFNIFRVRYYRCLYGQFMGCLILNSLSTILYFPSLKAEPGQLVHSFPNHSKTVLDGHIMQEQHGIESNSLDFSVYELQLSTSKFLLPW